MVLPEDRVLRSLSREARADSDEWPEFTLRDVRIYSQSGRTSTSLFMAHPTQPLIVEGRLDRVDSTLSDVVLAAKYQSENIRIRDVTMYSFSEDEDGTLGFWAAGRAGWYELRAPAKGHEGVFEEMTEATGMFYYLADKYRNARPRPSRDTARDTERLAKHMMANIEKYVNSDHSQRRDGNDALEGFHDHRKFLLRCMLEGQESLDWEGSVVFRYLRRKYLDDFKEMEDLVVANGTADTESGSINSRANSKPDRRKKHEPPQRLPEQRTPQRGSKRRGVERQSDTSSEDDESDVQTQNRSVLRPHGSKSAKKYARHLAATNSSADVPGAADDEEDSDENSVDQDTPSKHVYTAGVQNGRTSAPHAADEDGTDPATVKPQIRAAYYENIAAGDVWTCPYDGCNERVYDAYSALAKRLMEEHFSAKHADSMTDLIKAEMRPYNRVSHLLSRVKDLASMQSLFHGDAAVETAAEARDLGVVRRY